MITYQAAKLLYEFITSGDVGEKLLGVLLLPAFIVFLPVLIIWDIFSGAWK